MNQAIEEETDYQYAGFFIRLAATLVDWLWLYTIVYGILFYAAFGLGMSREDSAFLVLDILVEWIMPMVVVLAFWAIKSATPGKMLLKIKIVDANTGNKAGFIRLLVRYLAYIISMIPLFLGFMWAGWDKRKQAWHDKIAGTVVVQT